MPDKRKTRDGLYKISDLSRQTGVPTATIKFYLREGLLPPATVKTGRNMAYYDHSFVDRIRFIKELQKKRFLPLDVIKAVLNRDGGQVLPGAPVRSGPRSGSV
jgi:DNA-binding transcriptional MerR regulator